MTEVKSQKSEMRKQYFDRIERKSERDGERLSNGNSIIDEDRMTGSFVQTCVVLYFKHLVITSCFVVNA